jgi:hypothetical protein
MELDGDVDLLPGQPSSAHDDARAVQVPGHGASVDGESISELISGSALLVAADQVIDLLIA